MLGEVCHHFFAESIFGFLQQKQLSWREEFFELIEVAEFDVGFGLFLFEERTCSVFTFDGRGVGIVDGALFEDSGFAADAFEFVAHLVVDREKFVGFFAGEGEFAGDDLMLISAELVFVGCHLVVATRGLSERIGGEDEQCQQ